MDRALFVACALVLCALPSAFGLNCTVCTPNITTGESCDSPSQYENRMCMGDDTHCFRTVASGTVGAQSFRVYLLGCFKPEVNQTCTDDYQNTTCPAEIDNAANVTISATCLSMCCNGTDSCNMPMIMPTSTVHHMSSTASVAAGNASAATPTDAATIPGLVPQLGFVAFIAAVYFGVK